jgi:hypothetical protein
MTLVNFQSGSPRMNQNNETILKDESPIREEILSSHSKRKSSFKVGRNTKSFSTRENSPILPRESKISRKLTNIIDTIDEIKTQLVCFLTILLKYYFYKHVANI